ncbi:hypothetical protein D3C86_1288950 [compost metagenome]
MTSNAPSSTPSKVNSPLRFVEVDNAFPFTLIEAPGRGLPFSSVILPLMLILGAKKSETLSKKVFFLSIMTMVFSNTVYPNGSPSRLLVSTSSIEAFLNSALKSWLEDKSFAFHTTW